MRKKRFDNDTYDTLEMTNLIDILMVLLIIFMIVAPPVMQQKVKINLPEANVESMEMKSDMEIYVTSEGTLYYENHPYTPENLVNHLANLKKTKNFDRIIIKGDENTAYQNIINLIESLQDLQVNSINLAASPKSNTQPQETSNNNNNKPTPPKTRNPIHPPNHAACRTQ